MKYKIQKQYRINRYDYSQPGMYYVTICTKDKICYFGNVINEQVHLNKIGLIVKNFWLEIPKHFTDVELDEYIIMPNHIHGIIFINKDYEPFNNFTKGTGQCPVPTGRIETRHCPVPAEKIAINHNVTVGAGHCPVPVEENSNIMVEAEHCPVPIEENSNIMVGAGHCPVLMDTDNKYSTFGHVTPKSISTIIGSFKSICTKTINKKHPDIDFAWQPRFYDHIIRGERSLQKIRNYIYYNPAK